MGSVGRLNWVVIKVSLVVASFGVAGFQKHDPEVIRVSSPGSFIILVISVTSLQVLLLRWLRRRERWSQLALGAPLLPVRANEHHLMDFIALLLLSAGMGEMINVALSRGLVSHRASALLGCGAVVLLLRYITRNR